MIQSQTHMNKVGGIGKGVPNDSYVGELGLRPQPPTLVQTVNHFNGLYHKFEFFLRKTIQWVKVYVEYFHETSLNTYLNMFYIFFLCVRNLKV